MSTDANGNGQSAVIADAIKKHFGKYAAADKEVTELTAKLEAAKAKRSDVVAAIFKESGGQRVFNVPGYGILKYRSRREQAVGADGAKVVKVDGKVTHYFASEGEPYTVG